MRLRHVILAATVYLVGVVGQSASAEAASTVRTCGKVIASGGGPPSAMPRLTVTVQGGSVGCATARQVIRHFQSEITKHAQVDGYACEQINVSGDERCVKGATVIKGTYPG
ncbi:MAG: hypothetical protein ABSC56_06280 [Solirubrobacteraceae bacterium]|jgi:hypothetical protein